MRSKKEYCEFQILRTLRVNRCALKRPFPVRNDSEQKGSRRNALLDCVRTYYFRRTSLLHETSETEYSVPTAVFATLDSTLDYAPRLFCAILALEIYVAFLRKIIYVYFRANMAFTYMYRSTEHSNLPVASSRSIDHLLVRASHCSHSSIREAPSVVAPRLEQNIVTASLNNFLFF